MRVSVIVLASLAGLALSSGAYAAEVQSTPADQDTFSQSIAYVSTGDEQSCHHLVHQGELVQVVQCHSQSGWDRLRHSTTQKAIFDLQLRAELQRR